MIALVRFKPSGRSWAYAAAVSALAGVFMLYLQPDVMVTLVQLFWACF
jgi:hypothetical protein